ncbi:XAC0095 family protein, partial [Xanthomonas arboricola pv. corylina]
MHNEPGYWMSEGTQYHLLRVRDQLRLLATLAAPRARDEGSLG